MIVQHKGALYSNAVQFSSELQLSETLSPNATLFTLSKEDPLFALFALSSPIHLLVAPLHHSPTSQAAF